MNVFVRFTITSIVFTPDGSYDATSFQPNVGTTTAKSIAEIITMHGVINLDFNDVKTVLKNGGVAIMSSGYGEGEGRVTKAIESALHSPLLNNNDIYNSQKILLSISFCAENEGDSLMMEEMNEIHEFMERFGGEVETKFGLSADPDLGKQVKVTILATGFGIDSVPGMDEVLANRSREEAEHLAELEEQEQQRINRRSKYYSQEKTTSIYKRRHHIYIFNQDDLDNEDIISMVETTATHKRSKDQLESIKAKSSSAGKATEQSDSLKTITF